ncbi:hypothetical protein VTO42DRAFT_3083 [Malbranchea cinnamomea]
MLFPTKSIGGLALSIFPLATVVFAGTYVDNLSFGHGRRIAPWGQNKIPGWQTVAEGHEAEIMSDRVVLTPPYPGNKRGALWAETAVTLPEWTVDLDFRASGEERGSGNFQLWYVKDGKDKVGTASIYTVGQFDGFALAIDAHGGRGGSVRGFLNDGTTDYKSHQSVDSLAFGRCDYAYRNLGRPSKIQIKHTSNSFEVLVDQRTCFKTNKVSLPPGNFLGISAASAENPDSFEVFKLAVSAPDPSSGNFGGGHRSYQAQYQPPGAQNGNPVGGNNIDLSALRNQIADLQSRLNSLTSTTERILSEMSGLSHRADDKHQELLRRAAGRDQLSSLDTRLQRVERLVEAVQKDVQRTQRHFDMLQDTVQKSHHGLLEHVQSTTNMILSSTPRMGLFIFFVLSFQLLLAGLYVWYKRRRANMPKKFL